MPALVQFEDVSKEYHVGPWGRRLPALADINLTIEPGEILALLGPNRAGKTTVVKILLALCRATSGRATRFQRPVSDRSTLARVGYVHESPAFPRYLSACALLEFYGALTLLPEPVVRSRSAQLLERVGLADRASEPIARYSKGMVQRLALAQALLTDPDLLVLDEPSEGLDLAGRQLVREILGERRRQGGSVLLVSHVLGDVTPVCDRVGVLAQGRLIFAGPLANLPRDPDVAAKADATSVLEHSLQRLYREAKA